MVQSDFDTPIVYLIMSEIKKVIGNYLFEVIVIFIGITCSFLFEEWRQSREKEELSNAIMKSLIIELERSNEYISDIDSTYLDTYQNLQLLMDAKIVEKKDLGFMIHSIMEDIAKIRLTELTSYIHGLSSGDQLNIINKNKETVRYKSYLESLLKEHEVITNSVYEYGYTQLWQTDQSKNVIDYIVYEQLDVMDLNNWQPEFDSLASDPITIDNELTNHFKWVQLKMLRLYHIDQAIHRQIEYLIKELDQSIK